jgi:hypothetical protein
MVEDVQQGQHMRPVAAQLGLPNIIDDHVSNLFASALLRQKVHSQGRLMIWD